MGCEKGQPQDNSEFDAADHVVVGLLATGAAGGYPRSTRDAGHRSTGLRAELPQPARRVPVDEPERLQPPPLRDAVSEAHLALTAEQALIPPQTERG